MECSNNFFWYVMSLWWPVWALSKSQNALQMGCFLTKKWVNHVVVIYFSKNDLEAFRVIKQVKYGHFERRASHLGPSKVTQCLANGLI